MNKRGLKSKHKKIKYRCIKLESKRSDSFRILIHFSGN